MKFEFEDISSWHSRAKVFGGWIVQVADPVQTSTGLGTFTDGFEWRTSMVYVPDPNHEWVVTKATGTNSVPEVIAGTTEALNKLSVYK